MPTVQKYDKYGDPVAEKVTEINPKRKKAFAVTMAIQVLLIIADVIFCFTPATYCCFIMLPIYLFVFIAYVKAIQSLKDDGLPTKPFKIFEVVSLVLFITVTMLCMIAIAV